MDRRRDAGDVGGWNIFELYADKVKLAVRRREPVTSGSAEVYHVHFQFSEDWDCLTRTAVSQGGGKTVSVLLDDSGQCSVPWEALAGQAVGFDGEGRETAVTLEAGDNVTITREGKGIIISAAGGTMAAIPKFWYKLEQIGSGLKIRIFSVQEEGFHVSPAHIDRGDGRGERDPVYVGRYTCGSNYRSATGKVPYISASKPAFRTNIHKLGPDIWPYDFAMRFTIWLLYLVEFADWNSQAMVGSGISGSNGPAAVGYTDSMPYHTGTTQSSAAADGLGTQYRNIEGLWENVVEVLDGCYNGSNGIYIILNPQNFADQANGVLAGRIGMGSFGSDQYPSGFSMGGEKCSPLFVPSKRGGSGSTCSCDIWPFGGNAYPVSRLEADTICKATRPDCLRCLLPIRRGTATTGTRSTGTTEPLTSPPRRRTRLAPRGPSGAAAMRCTAASRPIPPRRAGNRKTYLHCGGK